LNRAVRQKQAWANRVPKVERMQSLEVHLRSLIQNLALSREWRSMELIGPICREVERRVEAANPGEEETRISAKCHKRLRKLGNALRIGWELELLGLGFAEKGHAQVDVGLLLERLETMGKKKQQNYMHIKQGDRHGAAALVRQTSGMSPAAEEFEGAANWQEECTENLWHPRGRRCGTETPWRSAQILSGSWVLNR